MKVARASDILSNLWERKGLKKTETVVVAEGRGVGGFEEMCRMRERRREQAMGVGVARGGAVRADQG